MVLATTVGEGTDDSRDVVLCVVAVAGVLYGLFRLLSIGRRGPRLPPGSFWCLKCDVMWFCCQGMFVC